jgi:hypothetical protein
LVLHCQQHGLLVGLCEIEADVEVELFLAVGLLEVGHDFPVGVLHFSSGADDRDLLVLLLDVVEGVVHFFEGGLSADAELCDAGLAFEGGHVVDHCLDFVRVEVESFDLEG